MKRGSLIVLVFLAVAFAAGADVLPLGSAGKHKRVEETKDKGAADRFFEALKAHDWDAMRSDFSDKMLNSFSKEQLAQTFGAIEKELGAYVSNEYLAVKRTGDTVSLSYDVTFANGAKTLEFSFKPGDGTSKIDALSIRPGKSKPAK